MSLSPFCAVVALLVLLITLLFPRLYHPTHAHSSCPLACRVITSFLVAESRLASGDGRHLLVATATAVVEPQQLSRQQDHAGRPQTTVTEEQRRLVLMQPFIKETGENKERGSTAAGGSSGTVMHSKKDSEKECMRKHGPASHSLVHSLADAMHPPPVVLLETN